MMIWNQNQAKLSLSLSLLTSPSIMCKILQSKNPLFISNFPKGKKGMEKEWKEKGSDKQTSGFPLWIHTFFFHFGLKMECLFFSYSVRDSSWSVSPWQSYRITNFFRLTENRNVYECLNITANEVSEWVCRWDSISFGVYLETQVLGFCIFETPTQTHLI